MRGPLSDCAVIFDLDGTLVDTAEDLTAAMNLVLEKEGLAAVSTARVRHLVGHGPKAMIRAGFAENGRMAPDDLSRQFDLFLEFYLDNIAVASRPFPGAEAALAALKADGAKLAVCTNKRETWARRLLQALGLDREFMTIVGADTAGAAKPDPRPVLHAMYECAPAKALFIGDSDYDIAAADAAGLPILVAEFGYGPLDMAARAYARFYHFGAVPDLSRAALKKDARRN